jgi:nucleoside transporter
VNIPLTTYIALSVVMFLEYAIWGAWAPVLATRLLGPLKMTGKQTGWIYATLPIACIFAPFISGWAADSIVNAEYVLIVAHALGAILLFVAAKQNQFKPLFIAMLAYSVCYAATLPLANTVLFAAKPDGATVGKVFIWAPVAWALVGWSLTGWRMSRTTQGDGSDCLYLAAALSALMVVGCLFVSRVSPSPPQGQGNSFAAAFSFMTGDVNFLIFLVVSMVVAGMMQFYFLGTGQFLQDAGVASKHVPASMALAQIAQALATLFLFQTVQQQLGFKGTLALGAVCWLALYLIYVIGKPRALVIVSQPLHGFAYVFFIIIGQVLTDTIAPASIRSSMQALIFAATTGVGLFLGTQFAGIVMDSFKTGDKFQWRKIWLVPAVITLIGVVTLSVAFHNPQPVAQKVESSK